MVTAEIKKTFERRKKICDSANGGIGWHNCSSGLRAAGRGLCGNWFRAQGFHAFQQSVCENRSNAIGIFKGAGGGRTLVFNSHMDSDQGRPRVHGEPIPPGPEVRIEGRRIFGKTVQNDRGPMAAFMIGKID